MNISQTLVALRHQDKFGFLMECRARLHVPNADTQKKKEKGKGSNTEIIIEEMEVYWICFFVLGSNW